MTDGQTANSNIMAMNPRELVQVALLGAATGLIIWALTNLLDTYLYQAVLCQSTTSTQCASTSTYASATATILGSIVGLFGLVRLRVFRPLLVVIAAMISLWGLTLLLADSQWYAVLFASAVMYGLGYAVFTWLARLSNFFASLGAMVVLVVVIRLIL